MRIDFMQNGRRGLDISTGRAYNEDIAFGGPAGRASRAKRTLQRFEECT